jgi:hypothetical protein
MNDYDLLIQFISQEPYRTIVPVILVFGLLDKVLKGKLNNLIQQSPSFIIRCARIIAIRLKQESSEHFSAIPKLTHRQQKIFAWGTILVDVLFSSFMTIQGIVFMLLSVAIINRDEPSVFKFLAGMAIGILFCAIAYFYRAGAHKTARDNNIDIHPWK